MHTPHTLGDLRDKVKRLENEREQARFYAKELEQELQHTQQDLHENKVNLLGPLKSRLVDLEQLIHDKEQKVKRAYKRKLRRCKRELENERKINISLAKRINLYGPEDRSISEADFSTNKDSGFYYINKKQCKSQLDIQRPQPSFNQFETCVDLKRYREKRTIDTPRNNRDEE